MVAFYGPKSDPLAGLLQQVQDQVGQALGPAYRPRPVDELHATVIGLDRPVGTPDVPGLCADLARTFAEAPLTLQFGGFGPDDQRLPSRGRTLAQRTLALQGRWAILIGLPIGPAGEPVARLGEIRRGCEAHGFRHKYHSPGGELDPDAYLVLGELTGAEPPRAPLGPTGVLARPTFVELRRADLALIEFTDPTLPRSTSRARPL